jgi:hypothetical protein
MLLWVTAPLLVAGILVCWQRRRQPLVQFLIAAILLAPIAAALTNNGTPHALRSSVMLPLLIVLAVLGADGIRLVLRDRSRLGYAVTAVLGLGLLAQGAVYTFDLYRAYPYRAASDFDTGEIAAITTARAVAGGHRVYLSDTLDQPYIEACFALVPQPPSRQVTDDATPVLQSLGLQVVAPGSVETSASSGDLLVLTQYDQLPPSGWLLVDSERPPPNLVDPMTPRPALVSIYRFVG